MECIKSILIVGNGSDVLNVDLAGYKYTDVLIMNQCIFHFDKIKHKIPPPTIFGCCGWYPKDQVFDPSEDDIVAVPEILQNLGINAIWLNHSKNILPAFQLKENWDVRYIVSSALQTHAYHSLGLQSLLYALDQGYDEVHFCGIDSYFKSHHFYSEDSSLLTTVHTQSPYITERMIIKQLVREGKIKNVSK